MEEVEEVKRRCEERLQAIVWENEAMVEQVKRMCKEKLQAIVRENKVMVERLKMTLQAMVIEAEAMAMVERVEMKHEKENMATK